ncbi:hypothetical protein CWI38_0727p0020 [Hamiltosporidium tvaerminnensis]|uniref:Uncharacterized protein n=1 Tax=Hamiltosporidium tvaerminnensis TaxID=1176355 RepID=A0A4Q9LXC6_9MICR|nr:hypothetical protein CWI38_0727p0020 [Hamiltosporidium tvaerminnensis]
MIFLVFWSSIFGSQGAQFNKNSNKLERAYRDKRQVHSHLYKRTVAKISNTDYESSRRNISEQDQSGCLSSANYSLVEAAENSNKSNTNNAPSSKSCLGAFGEIREYFKSLGSKKSDARPKESSLPPIQFSEDVVSKPIVSYKDVSQSDLPRIENFLNNHYFLAEFFKNNTEINYKKFIKNICCIEQKLMETQPGFSDSNQEIFERELEGIKSMFSPTCGILAKATFLISLKRFVLERLKSIDVSKKCYISFFLAIKSIESILLLTDMRLRNDKIKSMRIDHTFSLKDRINNVLDNNLNLIVEIIIVVCSFGLNMEDDFLKILNILNIGIRNWGFGSIDSKFNSPEISGTDFITDLVFSFDTNEIKKITNTYNSTETMSKDCLATATPLLSLINSCELEKILNEKEIVIQVIKYYLSIFSDSVLPFFNTEEKAELEKEQYISLETQFRKIISREDQNSEIFFQDLRKLRFETYHLFHSVFNHCYNRLLHDSEDQKE